MDWSLLGFKGLFEVVNVHPVFVHFPIALFPATLLFYFIGIVWRKENLLFAGRLCLFLTLIASAITVWTGELAEDSFSHSHELHQIMLTHEKIGIGVLILAGVLFFWSFFTCEGRPKRPWLFLLGLVLATLMVLQNGDLGGRMVFVKGAGVKAAVPAEALPHEHHHH
ncbi:MAG: DUF2231 domain-containing protein [Deltaproteobacteria bacterium]|nr:DUF2231 domain-containing protein [Deltaproteobacteria bacterium]MBI4223553.1 DUF2231 domain-containing protein [Deltaproteobacteria bacterium]